MLIALPLLATALAIVAPAKYYEDSIYTSTPWTTWALIGTSIVGGQTLTLYGGHRNPKSRTVYWGMSSSVAGLVAFLSIPIVRGYYVYGRGDLLTHIGITTDAIRLGRIEPDNFYPVTHLLFGLVTFCTGIDLRLIPWITTLVFTLIFVLSVLLLIRTLHVQWHSTPALYSLSTLLILGSYNTLALPNALSILLYPLALHCFTKSRRSLGHNLILVLLLLLIPFFNPLTCISLVITLAAVAMYFRWKSIREPVDNSIKGPSMRASLVPASILVITFISWFSAFALFGQSVRLVWDWLTKQAGPAKYIEITGVLESHGIAGVSALTLFLRLYGVAAAFSLVALVGIALGFWSNRRKKNTAEWTDALVPPLFLHLALFGVFLVLPIGFGPDRVLEYVGLLALLISPRFLLRGLGAQRNRAAVILVCGFVVVVSVMGLANAYPSPYTLQPNQQVTYRDVAATRWYVSHTGGDQLVYVIQSVQFFRLVDLVAGKLFVDQHPALSPFTPGSTLPDHFGYNTSRCVGSQIQRSGLLILTGFDRSLYTSAWGFFPRYNESDFVSLDHDSTASLVYDNGETKIYHLMPGKCLG